MYKIILAGAGKNGKEALSRYGKDKVSFFYDNNKKIQGTFLSGVPIISFEEMLEKYNRNEYVIIITPNDNTILMSQLDKRGITDYILYEGIINVNIINHKEKEEISAKEENKILDKLVSMSNAEDILKRPEYFKLLCKNAIEFSNQLGHNLSYRGYKDHENLYGNLHVLYDYSEISDYHIKYSPIVSHHMGVPILSYEYLHKQTVIYPGNIIRDLIHKHRPYVPVFSVGPYIQYAEALYSKDKINKIKSKYGKTLTFFLPHSREDHVVEMDKINYIDLIIKKYHKDFSHFMICVFWTEMNERWVEYAESKGIQVVSAGFRFDDNFLRRLKTILELSDAIVSGNVGSQILHALSMKIPVALLDSNEIATLSTLPQYKNNSSIKNIELSEWGKFLDKAYEVIDDRIAYSEYRKNWAEPYFGFSIKRSKEYVRNIFNISKDILLTQEMNEISYSEAVLKTYKAYKKDGDIDKLYMLKTAVGKFLD